MRQSNDLWGRARLEPAEILERLAGRGCYVVPHGGRGGKPSPAGTPADIAHALASSQHTIGKMVALAIVFQSSASFQSIIDQTYAEHLRALQHAPQYAKMLEGPRCARLRLVIQFVMNDLVWPKRAERNATRAKAMKMRKGDFGQIYRYVVSYLEAEAKNAASDARDFLYGD